MPMVASSLRRLLLLLAALLHAGCGPDAAAPATRNNPPEQEPAPLFENITARSGIDFTYRNGEETAKHFAILESIGGGVGLIDYDGDGLLDVFLPGGGTYEGPEKKSIAGLPCRLFRNLGGNKFQDATIAAGLERPWFYSHGVAIADYDRDGWPDLLVTGWRAVALFRNVPVDPGNPAAGRQFKDATTEAGLDTGIAWATSAAFADLDGDGYPDLYVCQYVDWSWEKHPPCQYDGKTPDVCPPRHFNGLAHKLYRNTGKGSFVEEGAKAGLIPGGPMQSKGLGVVVVDVDGDGKPDISVANDTVDNLLYMNKSKPGTLRFEERGLESGVARDDRGNPNGSMGTDAGDPERTGKPALWVTNYENELHGLYRNDSTRSRPFFGFQTTAMGIAAIGQKFVGWGTGFLDANRDGWEDLVIANGHAIRFPTGSSSSRRQKPILMLNQSGKKFGEGSRQIGSYATNPRIARGLAIGDLDNDGRPDVVISHLNEAVAVLHGIGGTEAHWIGVRAIGKDNACAVGTRVVWEAASGSKQTRFIKGGCSFASSHDRRALFGLGSETIGMLRVTWPDGTEQTFAALADRYYRIEQGQKNADVEAGPKP